MSIPVGMDSSFVSSLHLCFKTIDLSLSSPGSYRVVPGAEATFTMCSPRCQPGIYLVSTCVFPEP